MRRWALLFALVALAGCDSDEQPERPNVVVVMTDDQRVDDLAAMPAVRRLIVRRGAYFTRSFASFPLCCPSRATFLTGQFAHNHGVRDNRPPLGGYRALDGDETLPVWLQRAGYETAHFGKYLNGYGVLRAREVPPGWDEWQGLVDPTTYYFKDFVLNENGRLVRPRGYQTDELTRRAVRFVESAAEPFFLSVAYVAPHEEVTRVQPEFGAGPGCQGSAIPAARHSGRFAGRRMPLPPSFDEDDMSDKPSFIRALPRLGQRAHRLIERAWRCRRESLISLDEGIERLVAALRRSGELDRTLIVFTSDNGFFLGEHRIPENKVNLYEEAVRVPLAIRGPGVPAGSRVPDPVANVDLAPTILDAAEADAGIEMDGRSLLPVARRPRRNMDRPILLENLSRPFESSHMAYTAIRVGDVVYAEYANGEREMYDLGRDPHQLRNLAGEPGFSIGLSDDLQHLRRCRGRACLSRH